MTPGPRSPPAGGRPHLATDLPARAPWPQHPTGARPRAGPGRPTSPLGVDVLPDALVVDPLEAVADLRRQGREARGRGVGARLGRAARAGDHRGDPGLVE